MRACVSLLTVVSLASGMANGQRANARAAPTDVVRVAFAVFERGNYDSLVAMVDPGALEQFRLWRSRSVIFFGRDDHPETDRRSDVPQCVTAYYDSMMGRFRSEHRNRKTPLELLGVRDSEELLQLNPTAFFVRWMRADAMLRHQNDSMFWSGVTRRGDGAPIFPDTKYKNEVLGQVIVNDTVAYVIYERTMLPPAIDTAQLRQRFSRDTSQGGTVDTTMVFVAGEQPGPRIAQLHRGRGSPWRLLLEGDPLGETNRILEE